MTLPCVEIETAANPQWSIIWLHGLGADGHDFESLVPELLDPVWPALRFVFPHAPKRAISINGGMMMRAWYDISGQEITQKQDEIGIRASIVLLNELIEREHSRGIATTHILLAGFSQGGAIVLFGGVRYADKLGGIIALSSYLPLAEKTAMECSIANRQIAIFQAHGSYDPMVAQTLGLISRDYLRELGYGVDWHSYPMQHQLCLEEINDLRAWITIRIASG